MNDVDIHEETYIQVWGDTVSPRHLVISMTIGVVAASAAYLIAAWAFAQGGTDAPVAKSYGLLIGLLSCVLVAVVCSRFFKPKRILMESSPEPGSRADALAVIEEEIGDVGHPDDLPPATLAEVRALGLYEDLRLHAESKARRTPSKENR